MPEDIKELNLQRQREMAEERERFAALRLSRGGNRDRDDTPLMISEPRLEQITLPPSLGDTEPPPPVKTTPVESPPKKTEPVAPRVSEVAPPPTAATRPRQVEPLKKKGKKGSDDTDN